jgi:hypothetical protein
MSLLLYSLPWMGDRGLQAVAPNKDRLGSGLALDSDLHDKPVRSRPDLPPTGMPMPLLFHNLSFCDSADVVTE